MKETTCCVVGGGPAGIMLGYLLARAGVNVTVLEKHADFNRDFRGDTVHPSTMNVLHELGLLDAFLRLPHQEIRSVGGVAGDFPFTVADVTHVPARCKFVALMPQWDFLNFLSDEAKKFAGFELLMDHEAIDLLPSRDRIEGVMARSPDGDSEIRARLVVGCDGRHSVMRRKAGLETIESGVPIDVLWFRISRHPDDPEQVLGNFNYGRLLILINRSDYFQAGLIVPKGSFEEIRRNGIEAFRQMIGRIVPWLGERVNELHDWDQVKLLTVQINRLRRWHRPGLLCIGDAAHAMSPAGGVGINLAIQDAVAAARILIPALRNGNAPDSVLAAVQKRREFPTRITQAIQTAAHGIFARLFRNPGPLHAPWQLRGAMRIPGLQRALGRAVGMGVRPEHVTPPRQSRVRVVAIGAALGAAVVFLALRRIRVCPGPTARSGSRLRLSA